MLLSLMLAAGLTSVSRAPTDDARGYGLRCLPSIAPSITGAGDEGCRWATLDALANYVEGAGVLVEGEQSPILRDGMTPALLQPDPDPVVVVLVENPAGLKAPALDGAQELATGIYERAGVSLRWTVDETTEPDRTFTLVLTSTPTVRSALRSDAMGVAPGPTNGTRGTRAYVFLNQVQSFAARHRLVVMQVLACVLAHEIGHLLLPPIAHWPNSVMQDRWHPSLFPSGAPGLPGFTPDQARLLRGGARGR